MAPLTVLMTLMGLEVGGAETHAVVLARHLQEMGYRVLMASSGGIFEETIAGYGIKHYRLSLDNSRPYSLYRSTVALRDIVKYEEVALIHAHARIPAFVSDFVRSLTGVHLITTAHAMFTAGFPLKYLSRWGEKTIAVSTDVKNHLIKSFGVAESNIVVIPNGIDVKTFHPVLPVEALRKELNTASDKTLIIYASRLDDLLATVAVNLMEACGKLYSEFPCIELRIVGDGKRAAVVAEKAAAVNAKTGAAFVRFLGPCTDMSLLMPAADLVVGASRVALEAMACGKNVILAGGEGYGGLIQESSLDFLSNDNFTGRQFKNRATIHDFENALREFFRLPAASREEMSPLLREFIVEHYSSAQMAQETAKVYEQVIKI